jgi:hypothetical protein
MARVNIVKQIKIDGNWVLRSIPKKPSGTYDWTALPEGTYFIEWRDSGQRKREGLYSSHLTTWRHERAAGILHSLTPQKRGPKSKRSPLGDEN